MNPRKRFRVFFGLCALLVWSLACQFIAPAFEDEPSSNCYKVSFLGFTDHEDGTSTWRYQVDELSCAQDLSNWMLELPDCATVLDASPSPWEIVQPDLNFHLNGIKWQTGTGFQSGEFRVLLSGELTSGTVLVGVKGPDVAIFNTTGPVCDGGTVTPTATLDLTPSPEPTLIPPTAPTQPPASSGTILITDNDQTLTFTCNGNAVEVRGNANTVTLLGSCSSITVKGNGNTIYYSGSPVITNTGNENTISQR